MLGTEEGEKKVPRQDRCIRGQRVAGGDGQVEAVRLHVEELVKIRNERRVPLKAVGGATHQEVLIPGKRAIRNDVRALDRLKKHFWTSLMREIGTTVHTSTP